MISSTTKSVVLIILDGLGLSATAEGNPLFSTPLPHLANLLANFPAFSLMAAGQAVGLPWGEQGNSEVGHLNIGTGRIVEQDLPRISRSITEGAFFQNPALLWLLDTVVKKKSALHLFGLLSTGGVHSHLDHLLALLELCRRQKFSNKVYLHLILDGRDAPPKSALKFLEKIPASAQIATIMGRFYAMDRDKRWERTQASYDALVNGAGEKAKTAKEAVENAYLRGETDEFTKPTVVLSEGRIKNNDGVIFFNFRPDRARQITASLTQLNFTDFKRQSLPNISMVTFTNFGSEPTPNIKTAFFANPTTASLVGTVAQNKLPQLHLAETEKYAHVTYFLSGGREKPEPGEKRILIPSPKVTTYDKKPPMSAPIITRRLILENKQKPYPFSVLNFANPDMLGHTGNLEATAAALQTVDECLGQLFKFFSPDFYILITADHGNCEQMLNPETGEIDTEHTTNPVPLILIPPKEERASNQTKTPDQKESLISLASQSSIGVLADIAPTVLDILGVLKPSSMTGTSLLSVIR